MSIEQLQDNLQSSLAHFINLGKVLNHSYTSLGPSEQGTLMYALLMAGRRLSKVMADAHRLQSNFIPDITGINLIETRGELLNLMFYLEQSDCDLDIAFNYNDEFEPIFDPYDIVCEENRFNLFPAKEQAQQYVSARRLMIETSKSNYLELSETIEGVNDKIDKILANGKSLKRDEKYRMERFAAMEKYYLKNYWIQDREQLLARVKGEMKDEENRGKSEITILVELAQDIQVSNTIGNENTILCSINLNRNNRTEVAKIVAENRLELSVDDMMSHFRFREYDKLIYDHIISRNLLEPIEDYQGKLFVNKASQEFAKLIKTAVAIYVGFDNKINAAFLFYAMRDLGLVFSEVNNATLMALFMKDVYGEEISSDTITKPLRKCNGVPFCKLDENNLRGFADKEFERYKDVYWRCYSIINKILAIEDVECAEYLKQLHPAIESNDVFENLTEDDSSKLYYLSSVLRGETLMY